MKCSIAVLMLMVAVMAAISTCPTSQQGNVQRISHRQAAQVLRRQWKCKTPRSKLVYVADVLRERGIHEPGVLYSPLAIVVRLCSRESGCCYSEGQSCQSQKQETVHYEIFAKPNRKKRSTVTLDLVNDVSCVCR